MKLTRLKIAGFKSFVDPVEFLIEPGLTGVVGPNGCGKSNLVEAIRWVMGESSYKSLRASGMDDVIFAGSSGRPPREVAEVALQIDNRDRTAPNAFNDVDDLDVARRIKRDGGSVYRVNGREVRARDVQLLFADAATGARSPAMVRQGQIGEIIAAKPQARRRILEDAAGIAGLHGRRQEAELRLKAAETNLSRIDDILREIEQRADGLKRQSRQSQRYRALSAEIRRIEAMILLRQWNDAEKSVAALRDEVMRNDAEVATRTLNESVLIRQQAEAAEAIPALRDAAVASAAAVQRMVLERNALDSEEKRVEQRVAELARRAQELGGDFARETALVEDARAAIQARAEEEAALALAVEQGAAHEAEARGRLEAREAAMAIAEAALGTAQTQMAERTARRAALERLIQDETGRLGRIEQELARIERESAALPVEADIAAELERLKGSVDEAMAKVRLGDEAAERMRAAHETARTNEAGLRTKHDEAERAAQRLETELRTLAKLLAPGTSAYGPGLIEQVSVQKGYEIALGAALGEDLEVSDDLSGEGAASLPEGAQPMLRVVTAPEPLLRRLAQIGIVERAQGAALQGLLKPGQELVTREGDVWRWDGFVSAAEAPTPAARRLAERNRMADLAHDAALARNAADAARQALAEATARVRQAAEVERVALEAARAGQRDLEQKRSVLAVREKSFSESAARRFALSEARIAAEAGRAELTLRRDGALAELADLAEQSDLQEALQQAQLVANAERASAAEARAMVQTLIREGTERARRRQAISDEVKSWEERRHRAAGQMAEVQRRLADVTAEQAQLAEAPALFLEKRRLLLDAISAAEGERALASDRLAVAEVALGDIERGLRAASGVLGEAREQKLRSDLRLEAAVAQRGEILNMIRDALDMTPADLAKKLAAETSVEAEEGETAERQLERLKQDRERLGAVNLQADDELREVEARRDELAAERNDLDSAIRRLRAGIGSLNREGRERLLAAFSTVQGHFEKLFVSLFGGGTAQLELIESDDPLEAGLEIIARPPGKKPTVLTLLSGGEQALTAIALIFAVFLTNPSPICVLDEVDAPLDDANVERYCALLTDMAQATDTRFIVITHNPLTMSRMDRLFGVTMAERGVSQLVSVDLQTAEQFLEAS